MTTKVGQSGSTEETWRHAAEHGTRSSVAAEEGLCLVCVTDIAHTFVPTAAGAHRPRSASVRHEFHHDAAVHALLLERPTVAKVCLPALQHAPRAYMRQYEQTGPGNALHSRARPHSRVPKSVSEAAGEEDGDVGATDVTAVGCGQPPSNRAQRWHGGRARSQWAAAPPPWRKAPPLLSFPVTCPRKTRPQARH